VHLLLETLWFGVLPVELLSEIAPIIFPSPDLSSHRVLQGFEAIKEEFIPSLDHSNWEVRIVREETSHTAEGIRWSSVLLGVQLEEPFGILDLHL
jgi:hypothetical protein